MAAAVAFGAHCRRKQDPSSQTGAEREEMTIEKMPSLFVGHGAPTLALDERKGAEFARWGESLGAPRAILVVSAHWTPAALTVGTVAPRELIYDFRGFPRPLYELKYPSPGAPEVADRLASVLSPEFSVTREPERGLDHGVWVPLLHMFPKADVPVLQLSLPLHFGYERLLNLGRALAPLRDEGILVVGSGNATHNLRRASFGNESAQPLSEAVEFDAWVAEALDRWDVDALVDAESRAPAFRMNHPTVEHWAPIYVALGAAADAPLRVSYPVNGFEYASISRRSVQFG